VVKQYRKKYISLLIMSTNTWWIIKLIRNFFIRLGYVSSWRLKKTSVIWRHNLIDLIPLFSTYDVTITFIPFVISHNIFLNFLSLFTYRTLHDLQLLTRVHIDVSKVWFIYAVQITLVMMPFYFYSKSP